MVGDAARRATERVLRTLIADGDGDALRRVDLTDFASFASSSSSRSLLVPLSRALRGDVGGIFFKQPLASQLTSLSSCGVESSLQRALLGSTVCFPS